MTRLAGRVRSCSSGVDPFLPWAGGFVLVLMLSGSVTAVAGEATQTDWSGGAVEAVTVSGWDSSFGASEGISWLALPGQITLSGTAIDPPVKNVVSELFVRPASLDAADMDDDGDLDLVGAAFGGNQILWWRNEGGDPPVWAPNLIESGFGAASSVRAADVDGDGRLDVAGCAWNDDEVAVWFNGGEGVSWTRQSVATGFTQCHWVDAGDLDGDGDIDLLGAAAAGNTVAIWLNDGAAPIGWTMQVIDDAYRGARSLVPTDLDGDGDLDLLGTALDDDDMSWWSNDGANPPGWTRHIVTASLPGAHHADGWDMDLDGNLDIVALGFGKPWLELWWNDGGDPVGWVEEDIGDVILTPLVVGAGDLDGDGDMDVAATSNNWNRVMWWQNTGGPPGEWPAADVERDFNNAWPLAIADLDGNGTLDLVSGASGGREVAWWRLTNFTGSGVLESRVLEIAEDVVTIQCSVDADTPAGTEVAIEARIGSAPDDLGGWLLMEPDRPVSVLVRQPAYLQYRVFLSTDDPAVAPVLRDVVFEWTADLGSPREPGGRVTP